jgi:succinate-semialdehyde dehydrogenase/glutarate-semialdehyde dehydrogenase
LPNYKRNEILIKCADAVEKNMEELSRMLSTEMGKLIGESRGEIGRVERIFRGYPEMANQLFGQVLPDFMPGSEKSILFTKREPLGVVACITPFNYPAELCYHKAVGALAAGNAVIIKPSPYNPLTILRIAELCWEMGVPGNVLQVVTGDGPVTGGILASSPDVDGLSLTGSTEVGVSVAKLAAATLKHLSLELGGNDPFVVFEDADVEESIAQAIGGRIANAGQTCVAPKRFIVHSSIAKEFTDGLIAGLQKLKRGCPLSEDTQLGSLINPEAAAKVLEQLEHTTAQGAKIALGGKIFSTSYFEPTVLTDVTKDMDIAKDMEVFGPVFPIITFDTFDEAIEIANNTRYGLQAGVMSKDSAKALKAASKIKCGGIAINGNGCFRNVHQAFGGVKMSGVGREGISVSLMEMTQVKTYNLRDILA